VTHPQIERTITTLFLFQIAMLTGSVRIHFGKRGDQEESDLRAEYDQQQRRGKGDVEDLEKKARDSPKSNLIRSLGAWEALLTKVIVTQTFEL